MMKYSGYLTYIFVSCFITSSRCTKTSNEFLTSKINRTSNEFLISLASCNKMGQFLWHCASVVAILQYRSRFYYYRSGNQSGCRWKRCAPLTALRSHAHVCASPHPAFISSNTHSFATLNKKNEATYLPFENCERKGFLVQKNHPMKNIHIFCKFIYPEKFHK